MASLNQVTIMGNATRDPEVKYLPKGTAVAELSLAINETYKNSEGEKIEKVCFVEVTCWGRTAEVAGEYIRKGDPVLIQGVLEQDTWEDKTTGQKRSKLKVRASRLHLMGTKKSGAPGTSPAPGADDDEIPF